MSQKKGDEGMNEEFIFSYKIKKELIREARLSNAEKNLLMGGLHYARIRDISTKRRMEYKRLLEKFNKIINGRVKQGGKL